MEWWNLRNSETEKPKRILRRYACGNAVKISPTFLGLEREIWNCQLTFKGDSTSLEINRKICLFSAGWLFWKSEKSEAFCGYLVISRFVQTVAINLQRGKTRIYFLSETLLCMLTSERINLNRWLLLFRSQKFFWRELKKM